MSESRPLRYTALSAHISTQGSLGIAFRMLCVVWALAAAVSSLIAGPARRRLTGAVSLGITPLIFFVPLPTCPSASHHCLDPSTVWYMRPASPPPEEAFPSPQPWCPFKACVFHFCLCVSLLYVCACECPERELHLLDPELHEVMSTLVSIGPNSGPLQGAASLHCPEVALYVTLLLLSAASQGSVCRQFPAPVSPSLCEDGVVSWLYLKGWSPLDTSGWTDE